MTAELWTAGTVAIDVDRWEIGPLFVAGTPRPQGSKRGFVIPPKKGVPGAKARAIVVNDEPQLLKDWRADLRGSLEAAMAGREVYECALEVAVTFAIRRPKHHYVAGNPERPLKDSAPIWPTQDPDVDKLQRAVGDALTGIVWADDNLIVRWKDPEKVWARIGGVTLAVRPAQPRVTL